MAKEFTDWCLELQKRLPGETAGEQICRALKAFEGCSLKKNPDKLAQLFLANEVDLAHARQVSRIQTSCGTTYRALIALIGCTDSLATKPYESGQAVTWDIKIAANCGALISAQSDPDAWKKLGPGWGIHYGTPGSNNDHMEVCMSVPDQNGVALHGGGGRPDSLITIGSSDIRKSWGRQILHIIDPDKLVAAIPVAADTPSDIRIDHIPEPTPAQEELSTGPVLTSELASGLITGPAHGAPVQATEPVTPNKVTDMLNALSKGKAAKVFNVGIISAALAFVTYLVNSCR